MRAQAYLTHESATNLAEEAELDNPQKVVLSRRNREFKFLEEISQGDYIMDSQAKLTHRQRKRMERIVRIHHRMEYDLDDVFFRLGIIGVLASSIGALSTFLASWLSRPLIDSPVELNMTLISIFSALIALSIGTICVPFISERKNQKILREYGFIEFPKLGESELSETNLTHEQIYEIALIGSERARAMKNLEHVKGETTRKSQQMKSARILKELEQLKAQQDLIAGEIQELTDKISEIVVSGMKEQ